MILRFLWHWLTLTLSLFLLTKVPLLDIRADAPADFFWAALILIIVNTFVRPILLLISLPLVILSLGLFIFVINGIVLYWISSFVAGFHVPSFASAFWGALILSLITSLFGAWDIKVKRTSTLTTTRPADDKVIDI